MGHLGLGKSKEEKFKLSWQRDTLAKEIAQHSTAYKIGALQVPVEHIRIVAYYYHFFRLKCDDFFFF